MRNGQGQENGMDGDRPPAAEEPPPRETGSSALLAAFADVLTSEDDPAKAVARALRLLVPVWLDGCEVRMPGVVAASVGTSGAQVLAGLDGVVAAVLDAGEPRRVMTSGRRAVDVLPLRARASLLGVLVLVGGLSADPDPDPGLTPDLARTLAGLVALRLDAPAPRRQDGAVHEARLSLDAQPQSAAVARSLVRDVLSGNGMATATDTALLLVSELVSNALRHGDGPYELHVTSDSSGVVVSVSDRSPSSPRPRRPVHDMLGADPSSADDPAALDEDGRGLLLVEALADDWGWAASGAGKRVWFRLDRT